MNIREFIEKSRIKLEGSWEKYDQDFREATKDLKDTAQILAFVRINKGTLSQYHDANEAGWFKLVTDVWGQAVGNWPKHSKDAWIEPQTAQHESYILNLLRNGLLVEDAASALYSVMGYESLFEDIAAASVEMPKTNFADVLTNFIVKMPARTDAIRNMQTAIMQDEELAGLVVPTPTPVENIKENIRANIHALHEDFRLLKATNKLDEAPKKLFIRARELGITTESLRRSYLRVYKSQSEIGDRVVLKALEEYKTKLTESVNSTDKVQRLYETAIKHHVAPSELEETYKQLYESKIVRIKKTGNWAKRYYTESFDSDVETPVSPVAHKIHLSLRLMPSKYEAKFYDKLAEKYGEDFANRYVALAFMADTHNRNPRAGQNEKLIDAYLSKHPSDEFVSVLNKNIDSIVGIAKSITMTEADLNEYEGEKVFGRKKPEITIRKDPNAPKEKPPEPTQKPHGWLGTLKDLSHQYDLSPDKYGKTVCPNCEGSGTIHGNADSRCPTCKGAGNIKESWIKDSVKHIIENMNTKHWFDIVVELVEANEFKHNVLVSRLVCANIVEAVLPFNKDAIKQPTKPSHTAYLTAWAQKMIDKEIKLGHVKTEIDAYNIEQNVFDRVGQDAGVEDADAWEKARISFDKQFAERFGDTMYNYIINKMAVKEDVVDFPGNPKPKVAQNKSNVVTDISPNKKIKDMDFLVSYIKDTIERKDMSNLMNFNDMIDVIDAGLKQIGSTKDDFYKAFEKVAGENFMLYYLSKAADDRGKASGFTESKTLSNLFLLTEGQEANTAHKLRVQIARKLRELVDSSDINLLSNFESYEAHSHISLKLNVYQDNEKKLQTVVDGLKEYIKECGFVLENGKYSKGNLIIRMTPIRKTFRTGAYKNRETPTVGLEIIGPKKELKKKIDKNIVSEAPVANFQTMGDFDQEGSMPAPDRKLLKSEKAVKKIHDVFSKTPYDFNLYFINIPGPKVGIPSTLKKTGVRYGEIDLNKVKELDIDLYNQIEKTKNNAITLVYVTNFSAGSVPLTGWIIAHRFVHALEFDKGQASDAREIEKHIVDKFNNIIERACKKDKTAASFIGGFHSGNRELLSKILTMKSARDEKITGGFEFFPETFAQYLVTGSVKFNPIPKEHFASQNESYETLNNELQALSKQMGQLYDKMLKSCVGKAFTF